MPTLVRRWVTFAVVILGTLFLLIHFYGFPLVAPAIPQPQSLLSDVFSPQSNQAPDLGQVPLSDETTKKAPFNWADIPPRNPIISMIPLPTGSPADIPRLQYDFSIRKESTAHKKERERRLAAVKEAFVHSWTGYRSHAWLHDEVKPLSGIPYNPFGGWGATLVDSLDSLWIMGMEKDFAVAVAALEKIDFSRGTQKDVNIFETTIRYLGGFLAAYDLSGGKYPLLLTKAVEVAEMMYRAFDTENRMPITRWDWQAYLDGEHQSTPQLEVVAEIGSLTLEFTRLTQLTGDPKYFDAVQRISKLFQAEQSLTKLPGLWPLTVNPSRENFHTDNTFTIGGMADSVFEYLPKEFLLLHGRDNTYADMHIAAVEAAKKWLVFEPLLPPSTSDTPPAHLITSLSPLVLGTNRVRGSHKRPDLDPRGEHLTCFAGGMIALAARALSTSRSNAETKEDMDVALRLAQGCVWSYASTPTGIGPEIFSLAPCRQGRDAVTLGREPDWTGARGDCTWDRARWLRAVKGKPRDDGDGMWERFVTARHLGAGFTEVPDKRYMLRPEAVETLFVLWRITGDEKVREAAWGMFEKIVKTTRTGIAFAALPDVMWTPKSMSSVHEAGYGEGGPTRTTDGYTDIEEGGAASAGARKETIPMFDGMESFWTAETLKYFYLIFAETDVISLDEYVFNTEAHPLRWREGYGR